MKTVGSGKEEILWSRVLGRENLTIDNITYSCIVVKISGIVEEIYYYEEESFAVVKKVIYKDVKNEEIIYASPQHSFIQYPIFVGKKWNVTVDYKNNSIILSIECIGVKKVATKAGSFNCYVIKADYVFNETNSNPYLYQIIYLSERVGNIVKTEMYQNDTLVGYTELTEFHYSGYIESRNHIILVAATIGAFILILIVFVIYIFKK
ncbi:MAG: hypothetical protein DRN29_10190 [Thermoplasmata archaeon]|nr:MAG: hypothetical protein DRN29_10190 [Thermoplasmata archaeon]